MREWMDETCMRFVVGGVVVRGDDGGGEARNSIPTVGESEGLDGVFCVSPNGLVFFVFLLSSN